MPLAPSVHRAVGSPTIRDRSGHKRALIFALLLSMLVASSPGCMFSKVRKDKKIIEGYGHVTATVEVVDWEGIPLLVAAGRLPQGDDHMLVVFNRRSLKVPQDFEMILEPGSYILGAFEDPNHNLQHDDGERGVLSDAFDVHSEEIVEGIVLVISEVFQRAPLEHYERLENHTFAKGDVVPLSVALPGLV